MSGVKGIIGMHRFNICLVVLSLSCSGVKTPLHCSSNVAAPKENLVQKNGQRLEMCDSFVIQGKH